MSLTIPFERTVCPCSGCIACCKRQPGYLVPGDVERIVEFTGKPAKEILVDSNGGTVMNTITKITRRIRTIVPRSDKTGRCIFLTAEDKCSIHPVAPFGCAYVDTHMMKSKGHIISLWGMEQIEADSDYHKIRIKLPSALSNRPFSYNHRPIINV